MSERMTDVKAYPSGQSRISGPMEYGRKTRAEMVAEYRSYFERQLAEAQRALAIPDDELIVTTFLGPYAQRNREIVSE